MFYKSTIIGEIISSIFGYFKISNTIANWCKAYRENGIDGLRPKKKGNPFNILFSKSLTNEQRLELENLKLKIENERLKKGYLVKGGRSTFLS